MFWTSKTEEIMNLGMPGGVIFNLLAFLLLPNPNSHWVQLVFSLAGETQRCIEMRDGMGLTMTTIL